MDARTTKEWRASPIITSQSTPAHQLAVDHSERHSALLDAVRRSGWFAVRMDRLATGDFLVRRRIVEAMELFVDNPRSAKIVDDVKLPAAAKKAIRTCARPVTSARPPARTGEDSPRPKSVELIACTGHRSRTLDRSPHRARRRRSNAG
jgi:hypothetical protein